MPLSRHRPITANLRPAHVAAGIGREGIAAMQAIAVVQKDYIANPPFLRPRKLRFGHMRPHFFTQYLTITYPADAKAFVV